MIPAPPAVPRDPVATAALAVGAAGTGLSLLLTAVQAVVVRAAGIGGLTALSTVHLLLAGLLGAVALLLGVVALVRRGARRATGGAGLALGATLLAGVLVALLSTLLYSVG